MAAAVFESLDRANKIDVEQLARGSRAVDAGQDAGLGGGINEPVAGGQASPISGEADVAMADLDAKGLQRLYIRFRAGTLEIVDPEDFDSIELVQQSDGNSATGEATNPRNQQTHAETLLCWLTTISSKIWSRVRVTAQAG